MIHTDALCGAIPSIASLDVLPPVHVVSMLCSAKSRRCAKRVSSARDSPLGSYRTPEPSTMPMVH